MDTKIIMKQIKGKIESFAIELEVYLAPDNVWTDF